MRRQRGREAGCVGAGGLNRLARATTPWIGAPFVARATGMPNAGLALDVLGLAPIGTPLAMLLPQELPAATCRGARMGLSTLVPNADAADLSVSIPSGFLLVGQMFHAKVVALELGASGIVARTGTNASTATIGSY